MSDSEREALSGGEVEEAEEEDLFGEQEEEEEEQEVNDEDNEPAKGSDDDEDEDDEDEVDVRDKNYIDISLPRHAEAAPTEEDTYSLKVPIFLNVEARPFDPALFKSKVEESALERSKESLTEKELRNQALNEKLRNENTIRWRYSNSGNDEIIKQSNAHFVQWDDGSVSLKIGNELFDVRQIPAIDSYLVKTHDSLEILQFDSTLNKTINLLPASTFTSTHRKLTAAVKDRQKKEKILSTITHDDPMLKQRLADENERKTLKMRRQLESKRRMQEERLERGNSPAVRSQYSRENAYETFEDQYAEDEDEYDDEDDFIARDEEEEEGEEEEEDAEEEEERFERGAERLKQLKEAGASRYKEASEEANDSSDGNRKRRRIIDSEDEE
ncbi:Leo1-like protein-domain-containing protein [Scheffersomyces coipomensis]|uniref:Leo1-like protein-domain-containing protein n=1 Tax=Scheffersomyces coipomensis TaxID=1788519 RepID=UPI00315DBA68